MGIFSAMAGGLQATARDVTDERWWGGDSAVSGERVTASNVVTASAAFPVTSLLAETLGSLPLEFHPVDGETGSFPFEETLAYEPNPKMSGAEFWATFAFNAVLRGRCYAEPIYYSPTEMELWPLSPLRWIEHHGERTFGLDYFYEDGRTRHFRAGEVLTGSGISADGVFAVMPWKVAQRAIELANILEAFGANFFKNGARPSGVLSTDLPLNEGAIERLGKQFNGNFAGILNSGKVPVLEQGLKYLAVSASNTDAQTLEMRRHVIREMALNWRVPLFFVGEGENKQNDEQGSIQFVKYSLRPWTRRMEQAVRRDLMTPEQRRRWKPSFNLNALLRGDSATQWRNAVLARTASGMSANELRVNWFDLPRIDQPWADDPQAPLNSNRAGDTQTGGMTAPQDRSDA